VEAASVDYSSRLYSCGRCHSLSCLIFMVVLGSRISAASLALAKLLSGDSLRQVEGILHITSPRYQKRQRDISDEANKLQVIKKLSKAREQGGYIAHGLAESLTAFFAVPKGKEDRRLVYDGPVAVEPVHLGFPVVFTYIVDASAGAK
jgi:hypothetical protein